MTTLPGWKGARFVSTYADGSQQWLVRDVIANTDDAENDAQPGLAPRYLVPLPDGGYQVAHFAQMPVTSMAIGPRV